MNMDRAGTGKTRMAMNRIHLCDHGVLAWLWVFKPEFRLLIDPVLSTSDRERALIVILEGYRTVIKLARLKTPALCEPILSTDRH
jgi:hypothetical protein